VTDNSWVIPVAGLVGLLSILVGVCVRAGGCRRALRYYFVPDMPAHLHNGAFALIPLGIAFLVIAVGTSVARAAQPPATPTDMPPSAPYFLVSMLSLLVGMWWLIRPPAWMKPAWLRAEEQAIRQGLPVPDRRDRPYSPRAYALNWLGLIVLAAAWLAFGLPVGALLIGVSTGIALLVANRPTRA
jgi:hypothetical protein